MARLMPLSSDAPAALSVRRLGPFVGAEITGVDLAAPLDDGAVEAIKQAHAEHGVVVFPDQHLTTGEFVAFGRRLGKLTVHPFSTNDANTPELIVYDNKEGNPPPRTDIWHTDEMFRPCPPMGTLLYCRIAPEIGGDTTFANMGAIYEGLSDRMQRFLSGLEAVNDFTTFKQFFPRTEEGIRQLRRHEDLYPPVAHPVVRVHPVTGRKAIYVSRSFTLHIKGMEKSESDWLLEYLYGKMHIQEYHYRNRWEPDMLVFWDNRLVQHSAAHDYYPRRRLMERVTIEGDRPVGDAPPPPSSEIRRDLMPPLTEFEATRVKRQNDL